MNNQGTFATLLEKLSKLLKVLPGASASTKLMTLQKVNTKPNKGHNFISGGLVIIKRELRLKWNGNKIMIRPKKDVKRR